jgi:hypothetical protein
MARYHRYRYNPARGGHAPNDLRNAFEEAVEIYIRSGRKLMTLHELCGRLWNCSDVMPRHLCDEIGDLTESRCHTYAQGARHVREHLERRR